MGDIHSRIKQLRESQELSMETLAGRLGVAWQTIQQWEKPNGTAPKRARLEAVAKQLGTTAFFLLTGENEAAPGSRKVVAFEPTPSAYTHPNKTIAQVVAILEQTDETGRIMALGAIRAALNNYVPAKANPAS